MAPHPPMQEIMPGFQGFRDDMALTHLVCSQTTTMETEVLPPQTVRFHTSWDCNIVWMCGQKAV